MLRYLQVENFKSLKRISLPLERLNLFFGMNGAGKSSIIQSLLLLRQSFWKNSDIHTLYLSGDLINLGSGREVLCQSTNDEFIRVVLSFSGDYVIERVYPCKDTIKSYLRSDNATGGTEVQDLIQTHEEGLFGNQFCYLSAEHIGPRVGYDMSRWDRESDNLLGIHGEYAVPFLASYGDEYKVRNELCLKSGRTNRLMDQLSAWLAYISPGIKIDAQYIPYEEKAKLGISYDGVRLTSDPFTPINVGFGIPYALPLIVALLVSEPQSLVLLENPESHLHPRGQAKIAELIARAAASGTQIICESHSDHIINGIRVAVKNQLLNHDNLLVTYFTKNDNQETELTNINVDSKGTLSEYPDGLLDEWGILMSELF